MNNFSLVSECVGVFKNHLLMQNEDFMNTIATNTGDILQ